MANSSSVSEVEVSLSTVMALKEPSTLFDSIACSAAAAMGASVKTKDSIIRPCPGAIMPAPLAMPLMMTSTPPSFTVLVTTLGKVSVVMIARAASISPSGRAALFSAPRAPTIRAASSGSPITPVEAMEHLAERRALDRLPATASPTWATALAPIAPVNALALPELTTNARATSPRARFSRHQSTGAEGTSSG